MAGITALGFPERDDEYERVFQAECECGWLGAVHLQREWAEQDAHEHTQTRHKDPHD